MILRITGNCIPVGIPSWPAVVQDNFPFDYPLKIKKKITSPLITIKKKKDNFPFNSKTTCHSEINGWSIEAKVERKLHALAHTAFTTASLSTIIR